MVIRASPAGSATADRVQDALALPSVGHPSSRLHAFKPDQEVSMTCVVVGIDGSAYSKAALRFAADEAKLRRAELRVVTAWEVPRSVYPAVYYLPLLDPETVAEYARQQAQLEIDEILGPDGYELLALVVREGTAPDVLLDEARDATMLVLGSRGHGGFKGILLGSVSQHLAAHAPCPITIVHEPVAET